MTFQQTFQQFAQSIRDSAEYRETVRIRAHTGMLPPDVEVYLLEMADGRLPVAADEPMQSRTLALVRLHVPREEANRD